MQLVQLSLVWRSGAALHRLVVGADGVPHLDEDGILDDGDGVAYSDPPAAFPAAPPAPPGPARRGKAWTDEEEAILRDGFAAEESPAEIARRIGRTRGAVVSRLVRLGLLDEATAGLRYPVARPGSAASGEPAESPPA